MSANLKDNEIISLNSVDCGISRLDFMTWEDTIEVRAKHTNQLFNVQGDGGGGATAGQQERTSRAALVFFPLAFICPGSIPT